MLYFTGKTKNHGRFLLLLFFLFNFIFFTIPLKAQWVKTSTYNNGTLKSMVFSGTNIFAGGLGAYISKDNGQNWFSLRGPKDKDSNLVTVSAMAVLNGKLFAGTEGGQGVYVSSDNGRSWKVLNNGLVNGGSIYNVYAMLNFGNKVYATGFGKVYSISDTGTTWTASTGLPSTNIRALAANSNGVLFAGLQSAGVYRSTDQGLSWTQVNNGLSNLNLHSMGVCGSTVYAGTDMGPFLSNDNGDNWTAVNNGFTRTVYGISSVGTNVFAATGGEIYLSTNNGQTWTSVAGYFNSYQHSVMTVNGNNIYVITDDGAFMVSSDNGKTWTDKNKGLKLSNSTLLASIDGVIMAGSNISTDLGASWKPTTLPSGISFFNSASSSGNNFLLATSSGIYVSTDTCKKWTKAATGSNSIAAGFAKLNGKLFAGVDNAIYSSSDNGLTWTVVNAGIKDEFYNKCLISNLVTAGTQLWARTSQGMFYSDDNGLNWKASKVSMASSSVMSGLGVCKDVPFLATTGAYPVVITTDKGSSWLSASSLFPTNTKINTFLSVGDSIFAATANGVYTYSLTSPAWKAANSGFTLGTVAVNNLIQLGNYVFAIRDGAVWGMSLSGNNTLGVKDKITEPNEYSLSQNYPNPFNPSTVISYMLPKASMVSLKVYDILGKEVTTLVNEYKAEGTYSVKFNASNLPSGIYIYQLKAGNNVLSNKMMLLK